MGGHLIDLLDLPDQQFPTLAACSGRSEHSPHSYLSYVLYLEGACLKQRIIAVSDKRARRLLNRSSESIAREWVP